jgi:hypothetical protein
MFDRGFIPQSDQPVPDYLDKNLTAIVTKNDEARGDAT